MQHKAELTFQDQPVDLFFYRQAFERCVATYYVKNEKQQSFSLPSLFFFSTYTHTQALSITYLKHGAYKGFLSLTAQALSITYLKHGAYKGFLSLSLSPFRCYPYQKYCVLFFRGKSVQISQANQGLLVLKNFEQIRGFCVFGVQNTMYSI